jgi:hypothetical protein
LLPTVRLCLQSFHFRGVTERKVVHMFPRLSYACHITLSVSSSTSTNLSGKYKLYDLSLHNCIHSPRISYIVTFFSAPLLKDDCFRGLYSSQRKKKQKNKKLSLSYLHNRVLNHILMLLTSSQEPMMETAGGFLCLLQLANKLSDVTCKKMSHEAEYIGETHHHSVLGFIKECHLGFLYWSWQELMSIGIGQLRTQIEHRTLIKVIRHSSSPKYCAV